MSETGFVYDLPLRFFHEHLDQDLFGNMAEARRCELVESVHPSILASWYLLDGEALE